MNKYISCDVVRLNPHKRPRRYEIVAGFDGEPVGYADENDDGTYRALVRGDEEGDDMEADGLTKNQAIRFVIRNGSAYDPEWDQ
jgi:hypothetical protein